MKNPTKSLLCLVTLVVLLAGVVVFTSPRITSADDAPLWIFSPREVPVTGSDGSVIYVSLAPRRAYNPSTGVPLSVVTQNNIVKILWTLYKVNSDQTVSRVPGVGGAIPSANGRVQQNLILTSTLVPNVPNGSYKFKVCTLGQIFCEMSAPIRIVNP